MYYELRLFNKTNEHHDGYCFQVANYSSAVMGLEQFSKSVEFAEDCHKRYDAAQMPKQPRAFANYIQLVRRDDAATWLDEVATWEHQL